MHNGFHRGEEVAKLSIAIFVSVGSVELLFGLVSYSIALTADSAHTFTDALISIITFLGLKISRRLPDNKFHFGYYRVETLAAAVSALVMVIVGVLIIYWGYVGLMAPQPLSAHFPAMFTALTAAVVFWSLGAIKMKTAKEIGSKALGFDSYNTLKSGGASFSAFLGILLSYIGLVYVDALAGMIIGASIFIIAYVTIKEASLVLLDACLCPDVLGRIRVLAKEVPGVEEVEEIRLRRAGIFILGELTIKVDGKLTVEELDNIVSKIKESTRKDIINLLRLTVQAKQTQQE